MSLNQYIDSKLTILMPWVHSSLHGGLTCSPPTEKVTIITADSRTLIGTLISADNQTNLVSLSHPRSISAEASVVRMCQWMGLDF